MGFTLFDVFVYSEGVSVEPKSIPVGSIIGLDIDNPE